MKEEYFTVIEYPSHLVRFGLIYKGPKPQTTEEGWQKTLGKWEAIVGFLEQNPEFPLGDGGAKTCGLCDLFFPFSDSACKECPIAQYTGHLGCEATPYMEEWERHGDLASAMAELVFLKEVYKEWKKEN